MSPLFTASWLLNGALALFCSLTVQAETLPGGNVDSLLAVARENNPDYLRARRETDAARERVLPAGTLPDPRLRVELMDITRDGEQNPTVSPSRAGAARYTLMQELPWFGKRDLRSEIARLDAEGSAGRADGTWTEVAYKIKTLYAQRHFLTHSRELTREMLDLMQRLEKLALARYRGGLAALQDVIRAQAEQSSLRSELITLDSELRQSSFRTNALLGRPSDAPLAAPVAWRPLPVGEKLDYARLENRALATNPLLAVEALRLEAAEKNRQLIEKNRYPDFTVGLAPNQQQNRLRQWDVMVEVSLPLQQASRRSQEREAAAMVSASRAGSDAATRRLLAELAENLSALTAARDAERLTVGSLLPQAEMTFEA
ncbi:MAG TPA: TolC family protein, partial [Accumulibacter sp.]|nr:TolC family protein [Accumulibacter sp.]